MLLSGIRVRQWVAFKATASWMGAWILWYYAAYIGAELKEKVYVSVFDFWPGLLITISYVFILPWDGGDGRIRLGASYRSGGVCAPDCFKTVVGGGLFMSGTLWGMAIALQRFFIPLPNHDHAEYTIPGWLMLGHILLLAYAGYAVMCYTRIPESDRTTFGDQGENPSPLNEEL